MSLVVDSSAVLAAVFDEPGAMKVASVMDGALISAVNYSEVLGKMLERGWEPELARRTVTGMRLIIVTFDTAAAEVTATIQQQTRANGLSLGDRACLTLAASRTASVLTADKVWKELDVGVEIELIR